MRFFDRGFREFAGGQFDSRHVRAHVKAECCEIEEFDKYGREQMLSRVLLHVVIATMPIDDALRDAAHRRFRQGRRQSVLNLAALIDNV